MDEQFFYTRECKDNEIAYFKVDVNLIAGLDCSYLGLVFENYALFEMSLKTGELMNIS